MWALPEQGVMLQLGFGPVQTIYLPVITMVSGVSSIISHGQELYQSVMLSHVQYLTHS